MFFFSFSFWFGVFLGCFFFFRKGSGRSDQQNEKGTVSQSSPIFSLRTALQYLSDRGKLYYPCIRDSKTVLPKVQIDLLQIMLGHQKTLFSQVRSLHHMGWAQMLRVCI